MKLRTLESDLEGHPTPRLNFVDVATGSLGQGLSVASGMAYCGKFIDKASYRFALNLPTVSRGVRHRIFVT
jgi:transketolase